MGKLRGQRAARENQPGDGDGNKKGQSAGCRSCQQILDRPAFENTGPVLHGWSGLLRQGFGRNFLGGTFGVVGFVDDVVQAQVVRVGLDDGDRVTLRAADPGVQVSFGNGFAESTFFALQYGHRPSSCEGEFTFHINLLQGKVQHSSFHLSAGIVRI